MVIVESPAKAKTIEKYLGADFMVRASIGHIRDLPKSNKDAIDINGGFIPRYVVSKDKDKVIAELKKLAKKASDVILATDPDREGEAIAWHLKETLGLVSPKRVAFHEITERAVQNALENPRSIDEHLKSAQEARRVLDRLVGYDLSGLIWKKVRYGLSAGRVQSPALRIICERERGIRAFIPEAYFVIRARTKTKRGEELELLYTEEPRDVKEKDRVLMAGNGGKWMVERIEEKEERRMPKAPFITSTLQQTASSRLGFTPSRTMRAAQKLYEAGHITYMRTDSTNISKDALSEIVLVISKEFGRESLEMRVYKTKSKNAQEAHEAIRPSKANQKIAGRGEDEKKLYSLIRSRTLSSQMKAARLLRTKIVVQVSPEHKEPTIEAFTATGVRVLSLGWIEADPLAKKDDVILPSVVEGEELNLLQLDAEGKETEGPGRYSEAGLIKELEKRGIGRPSTYASIITTIIQRGYVEKEGKSLRPTDTGEVVSSFLEEHFSNIISDTFTAEMEEELDEIARGEREYEPTLRDFYTPFCAEIKKKEDVPKVTNLGDADADMLCPACDGKMIRKLGKSGIFISCSKFPECKGARTISGDAMEGPKETGEDCPECNGGKLVERTGKFGTFVACGKFPKCKYIVKDPSSIKTTGVKCPECKKGEMAEKRGRFGEFYACTNYPDCKNTINAKPTGAICDYALESGACGALMMEGTKTIPNRCSDKKCPNNRPDKLEKSL